MNVVGLRLVVIVGTLLLVVLLLLLLLFFLARFSLIGGLLLTLRSVLFFDCGRWESWLRSLFVALSFGLLLGCLLLIKVEVPSRLRFRGSGRFMMSGFSLCLVGMPLCMMSLLVGMCFHGLDWSRAAESALADAFRFSGGPLPTRGLVLGRGSAMLRIVQLGGPRVRRARAHTADALDATDIFLYRDFSLAPLLDMRRRFKAVMNV